MRLGIIADIHGNLPALLRVLRSLRKARVDRIFSLGDLVGYNGHPNQCARLIRDCGIASIVGNHDLIAIGRLAPTTCAFRPAFALRRTRTAIAEDVRRYLQELPSHISLPGGVVLVHGSPSDVTEYLEGPDDVRRAARSLARLDPGARLCFFGHTHDPAIYRVAGDLVQRDAATGRQRLAEGPGIVFVNPGSVDAARRPNKVAEFATYEPDTRTVEFHAVDYNHEIAESVARARGYRMPVMRETMHSIWHWCWRTALHSLWLALKRTGVLRGRPC